MRILIALLLVSGIGLVWIGSYDDETETTQAMEEYNELEDAQTVEPIEVAEDDLEAADELADNFEDEFFEEEITETKEKGALKRKLAEAKAQPQIKEGSILKDLEVRKDEKGKELQFSKAELETLQYNPELDADDFQGDWPPYGEEWDAWEEWEDDELEEGY